MSRTAGSKNKPKPSTKLKVIDMERHIEGTPIQRLGYNVNGTPYVNWGYRNDYPTLLLNLFSQSPTHSSAIRFGVNAIVGDGIDYDAMQIDGSQTAPNYRYSWDDLIRNISQDYLIFGFYAIQIIKNKDGNGFTFYHMPAYKVRFSEYDDDGVINGYWVSSDWSEIGMNPPIWIEAFDMLEDNAEVGKPYLYVYRPYDPTSDYYPTPSYASAIKAIQSEIEHINFDLKTTINGFVPSGMLVLNEYETEEEKQAVVREIQKMFVGTENANSLMITFRNSVEDKMPEFVPFTTNSSNYNLYSDADVRTRVRILAAHRIADAALCGLPSIGSTGFASEADKLKTGLEVYMRLVGQQNKDVIVKALNFMFKANGVETEIVLKPFHFGEETTSSSNGNVDAVNDSEEEEVN